MSLRCFHLPLKTPGMGPCTEPWGAPSQALPVPHTGSNFPGSTSLICRHILVPHCSYLLRINILPRKGIAERHVTYTITPSNSISPQCCLCSLAAYNGKDIPLCYYLKSQMNTWSMAFFPRRGQNVFLCWPTLFYQLTYSPKLKKQGGLFFALCFLYGQALC